MARRQTDNDPWGAARKRWGCAGRGDFDALSFVYGEEVRAEPCSKPPATFLWRPGSEGSVAKGA